MSDYKILEIQKLKAKKYGVEIKPSTNKKKKIDVFKDGKKLASIGAYGYKDFGTYLKETELINALNKRKNYLKRHSKEPKEKDGKKTPSFWADNILW
tara:strand:+ start:2819 stop:3109 length:291 start_codon:yes stop_codon:yes gene_type:complete